MLSLVSRLLRRRSPAASTASPELLRELLRRKDFDAAERLIDRWPTAEEADRALQQALRGELHYHRREDAAAEAAFRAALKIDPAQADAHYGLSLVLADAAVAAGHAQFAVNCRPGQPAFLAQLGYLHLTLGNPQAAEGPLAAAVRLDDRHASAWNNLGLVRRMRAQLDEAQACFEAALRADPAHTQAAENLQHLEQDRRELGLAPTAPPAAQAPDAALPAPAGIDALEQAFADAPEDVEACHALAMAYLGEEDIPSATQVLELGLARHPGHPRLEGLAGLTLARTRRFAEALPRLYTALEAQPEDTAILVAVAACHSHTEEYTLSMAVIERARAIAPQHPQIRSNYLTCLTNLCRYEEALALCQELEAEGQTPACTGLIHIYLGQDEAALAWLDRQLALQPNEPGLRLQRAQLRLSHLDFEGGWEDYRYRGLGDSRHLRMLPFPLWQGEPLQGKRLIVLAEQGLGDQVMFASCLPDLLALQPAAVFVEVQNRIAPTIERSFPACRIVATRQNQNLDWVKDCGEVDYFVPLADLPAQFRRRLSDFPAHRGYLQADPARIAHWNSLLPARRPGRLRIGLSWRGGTEGTRTFIRSIAPAQMAAHLAASLDADWVCLQYGRAADEVEQARQAGLAPLHYWPESIADLDEFSALIRSLDLVITVCNTTVHYAGALGVPVWVLAPQVPEWRYGLHNEVLPWYPSSRMFRQTRANDWDEVLDRLGAALRQQAALLGTPP